MVKLVTDVPCPELGIGLSLESSRILSLGSCFSSAMAERLAGAGFTTLNNPFGVLYNPISILNALRLLSGERLFTREDVTPLGAGSNLVGSFYHHTSFARPTAEEFLQNANEKLLQAREFFRSCNTLIITLGTAYTWALAKDPSVVVANCLKRPGIEFVRSRLSVEQVSDAITAIRQLCVDKKIIFTISPIRHMGEFGAHANTLSKATLHIGLDTALQMDSREGLAGAEYFPAYEIQMDQLRDYRFYAEDMVHPSAIAESIIWEKFILSADPQEQDRIRENEKAAKHAAHIQK